MVNKLYKPTIKIIRFKKGFKSIIGKLYIDDKFFCFTLEREWLNNQRSISCIPAGKYSCKPYSSDKYLNVTQVTNVLNRDKILIHAGNYYFDIEGCILLGDRFDETETMIDGAKDSLVVWNSKKTLKKFFAKVGREFELEIIDDIDNQSNVFIEDSVLPKPTSITVSTQSKKKMIPLIFPAAVSLVKLFAPSIINKFKKAGKNLAEDTAKKLIKKAEKKLGFNITDVKSAEKAKDQLDSKDLFELEKVALKVNAKMFRDELKYGEDLNKSWKDEFVTVITFLTFITIVIMAYCDPQSADELVSVIKALLLTPFGALFIFVGVSAIGGKHILNKLADKLIK